MRLALVIEYEGAEYHGFQYQPNAPTIQEELEKAIARFTGERVRVKGAGRTDARVHAAGQVVAFDTDSDYPADTVTTALNFHLPEDIAVRSTHRVDAEFDPRRDALSRTYVYTVLNAPTRAPLMRRTSHHVVEPLNVEAMRDGAGLFVGRRDFSRFAAPLEDPKASTVREVFEAEVTQRGAVIGFLVRGSSFLPHQIRRMAGILVETGRGKRTPNDIENMLGGCTGGPIAHSLPPEGLCLESVQYADFPPKD